MDSEMRLAVHSLDYVNNVFLMKLRSAINELKCQNKLLAKYVHEVSTKSTTSMQLLQLRSRNVAATHRVFCTCGPVWRLGPGRTGSRA